MVVERFESASDGLTIDCAWILDKGRYSDAEGRMENLVEGSSSSIVCGDRLEENNERRIRGKLSRSAYARR